MNDQLSRPYPPKASINEPWYGHLWAKAKQFPQGLARGNSHPPQVSGEAAAAMLSAAIGAFVMMVTHHLADTSEARKAVILSIGSWIPGTNNPDKMWGNIGNYAGKETMLLVGWLVSWVILYFLLKNKQIKATTMLFWTISLFTLATAMSWHPLFPYLPLM